MSDQTEDEAHAKRGLAEAEDEGDAKRSKIEQQVPPTELDEDIEAKLLRELGEEEEEEKKKEQAVAAVLGKLEEERQSELKEQAQQAEPQKAEEADESARWKAELQTHEEWPKEEGWGSIQGQEATATVPHAFPLAREAPVASAARAAEWHGDVNAEARQQQCAKEGMVEQSNEAPIATSQPPLPATETPANSAARAAEWNSSMDALADAHSDTKARALDAGGEKEGKKPDEDMKDALPRKIVLYFNGYCAPKIVGRAGGSINKVRENTGADVRIKKDPDCCEITISARNPGPVQKAKQMVIELAGEQPNPYFAGTSG